MKTSRHASAAMMMCVLVMPVDAFAPIRSLAAAAATALPDPASLFASRSPHGRTAGALATTKPGRPAPAKRETPGPGGDTFVPHERVLPGLRTRPPATGGGGGGGLIEAPPVPGGMFVPDTGFGPLGPGPGLTIIPDLPFGPGPIFPGIPIGGVVVPPTSSTPVTPTPVINTPVPEPSTWAMMILGFGLVGIWSRHARRAAAAGASLRH